MKKKILNVLFFITMFLMPNVVFAAYTGSEDLKYDVSSLNIANDKITIEGWARKAATETGDHNVGGKNLRIYIAAVVDDANFENNVASITNHLNSNDTADSDKDKVVSGKYIIKETNSYTNENLLFPTLCLKDCGGNCCENPYKTGTAPVYNRYSTCEFVDGMPKDMDYPQGDITRSTCVSYDTGFKVEFMIKDELKIHLLSASEMVNIRFMIFLIHYNDSRFSKNLSFFNAIYNKTGVTKKVYSHDLGMFKQNCVGCNRYNEIISNIFITTPTHFRTEGTGLTAKSGTKSATGEVVYTGSSLGYFKDDTTYEILDVGKRYAGQYGTGVTLGDSTPITMYKLHYNESSTAWAWSTWGVVDGKTVFTLYNDGESPVSNCLNKNFIATCKSANSDKIDCKDKVVKTINTEDPGLKLTSSCPSTKAKINIYRVYDVNEIIYLNPTYKDVDGEEYNLVGGNISVKDGRFFGFDFNVARDLTRTWETDASGNKKIYFGVQIVYDNSANGGSPCELSDEVYMTKTRLFSLLERENVKSKVNENISGTWNFNEKELSNYEDSLLIRNDFPDSNELSSGKPKILSSSVSKNIVKSLYKSSDDKIYALVQKPCLSMNGSVRYISREESCRSDEVNVTSPNSGYLYFLPFGFNGLSKIPSLDFELGDDISYFEKVKYNFCNIISDDDTKLNNYRYRVIDLTNPFPNNKPGQNNKANNWLELWNNNNRFLYERYIESNRETYKVNLSSVNIAKIRKSNYDDLNNVYLKVNATDSNSLFNDTDILKSEGTISKYKVGTKEVAQ